MDKHTALKALSLEADASKQQIEQAYQHKKELLEQRINSSDSPASKATLRDLSARMDEARIALLNDMGNPEANKKQAPEVSVDISSDINHFMKEHSQSERRRRSYWLLLLIIPLFFAVAWYTGFFADLWEKYRPLNAEEQAAYDASVLMQSDIQQRQQSLTAARIILQQRIEQAEQEQSEELPVLQETMALADKSVFQSPKRQALDEKEIEAQHQFEEKKYIAAEQSYQVVQTGFQELEQTYEDVQLVPVHRAATQNAQAEWEALQQEYDLATPEQVTQAEQLWEQAEQKKEQEAYQESTLDYDEAKKQYIAAQIAMADEVARRKARIAATRAARLKKWRERLAWLRSITPKMEIIPAGHFTMGDAKGDKDAQPEHKVTLPSFKLSRYELPVRRFEQFVKETAYQTQAEANTDGLGCAVYNSDGSWDWKQGYHWQKVGFTQTPLDPAICISWNDAQAYIQWLNKEWDGKRQFRLVSEAEWEYAARAGAQSKYPMGDSLGENKTVCDGCGSVWDVKRTAPADSFALNPYKLHAMPGNVWEWTMDCWHDNYQGAPEQGTAWINDSDCQRRVLRGGSWFNKPKYLEAAYRGSNKVNYRGNNLGFRVAETLTPGAKDYDIEE